MIQEVFKPASLPEAVKLHKEKQAVYLSGGTWVNRAGPAAHPEKAVLLGGLLPDDVNRVNGRVEIGAGITLQALMDAGDVPGPLRRAAGFIFSRSIRNMATLGGNIAANRTDSYILPALIALNARVKTADAGEMPVEDYPARGKGALIAWIILPEVPGRCAVDRAALSSAAYPTLTFAVRVAAGEAVIALGCVADRVIRLQGVEEKIISGALAGEENIFNAVYAAVDPPAGLKESSAYRKTIAAAMVARAVMECRGERV
jgi:putative selenate reductase FAD-binding subunit